MFRFTIRELVLLTLVVALGVGWWVERRAKASVVWDARILASLSVFGPGQKHEEFFRELVRKYGAYELTTEDIQTRPFVKIDDTWDGK